MLGARALDVFVGNQYVNGLGSRRAVKRMTHFKTLKHSYDRLIIIVQGVGRRRILAIEYVVL